MPWRLKSTWKSTWKKLRESNSRSRLEVDWLFLTQETAFLEWKGNVTNNVSYNVTGNIQPVVEELRQRLEVLEKRVIVAAR
jgi:hypothetical protein